MPQVEVDNYGTIDFPDDMSPGDIEAALNKQFSKPQSMPPVTISPYEKAVLGGQVFREGGALGGPATPLSTFPELANVPAAAIEQTGIMQGIGEMAADFLRRTGINPAAQAGESLVPPPEQQGAQPPSPLEEAFPGVAKGLEKTARGFVTPENLALAPFAGFRPVQAAFEAQMAAGVPEQAQAAFTSPTTEERVQAGSQAILGLLAGAHALLPKAATEASKPIERTEPSASEVRKTKTVYGDVQPQQEPTSPLPEQEGGQGVQPQAQAGVQQAQPEVLLKPAPAVEEGVPRNQISKAWDRLVSTSRSELEGLLSDWNESELSRDGQTIQFTETRGGTGKMKSSKSDFFKWLFGDKPLDPKEYTQDPEWVSKIQKARQTALGKVAPAEQPGVPQPSAGPGGVTVETPVAAGETPQASLEGNVTPQVTQVGSEPIPQGPGARTYQARPETPESYEGTGLKNAIGEVERASYGLPEATETERRSMGAAWIRSGEAVARDPEAGSKLVQQLKDNPNMGLTDDQSALLLRQKVKVENDLNNAAERTFTAKSEDERIQAMAEHAMASDNLLTILDAAKAAGERWGREGRWRQAIAKEDYSFASMERQARVAKGGDKLSDDELTKLKAQHDLIQQKLADAEKATLAAQVDAAMARAQAEAATKPIHPKILETAKKIVGKLDERADAARARLKEKFARTSAGVDPTILVDVAEIGAAHLAHNIVDFAEWSDKMVSEFGEKVKPYLEQAFNLAKQRIDKLDVPESVKKVLKEGTPEERKQGIRDKIKEKLSKNDRDIAFYVQKLARMFYEEGVRGRDAMVKALHGELKKVIPDITERQTADAFSGYGDFKQLSKDDVTVALRGMKGELQQLAKLEDMAKGEPPLKSGLARREPTDVERELIKKVNEAKFKFQVPISDPETQLKSALDTLKTTLANRIKDYQKRLAEGDFAPRVRRELVLDRKAMSLKAEAERAKNDFQRALQQYRNANRATWQKAFDKFVRVERFFKLSSPVVFGKLLGAALARGVTTATEEAVGGALGKVPGISRVARQAPREGGLNVKAMAQGLSDALSKEAITQSFKKARTGETDIESLYSKKGSKDRDWTNFMGQLHGALKTPVLLGEFRLSLEKRLEHAISNRVDVSSPEVLARIQAEAMDDAYRSIFMQRGFTSDLFNTALNMAEKSKKYPIAGEIFARTARFLMPVVRVPLNIVGETTTGVVGTPVASTRLMFHAIRGTLDTLDPKVADGIMRQFKKGSIGLGLMAIGYFNPQLIGGFDYREKRKEGAAKTAGFQLPALRGVPGFGKYGDVPRWATHAPWFELMQIGATIRHVQDQHTKTGTKGISEGMWAAAWGLVEQTPFFDQMLRWTRASESAPARTRFLGELAKSTLVPQAVSKVAEITDPRKVKPTTIPQYVESGIPELRKRVPTNPRP